MCQDCILIEKAMLEAQRRDCAEMLFENREEIVKINTTVLGGRLLTEEIMESCEINNSKAHEVRLRVDHIVKTDALQEEGVLYLLDAMEE